MAKKKIKGLVKLLDTISNMKGKTYLMICELIDNSLSSWLDDGKNSSVNGLNIKIDVDFSSSHERQNKIIVTDNAYGMNEKELENALILGFKSKNKKSGLAVFGMGLKQAAFWMGHKLSITTKKDGDSGYIAIIDLEKLKRENGEFDEEYDLYPAPSVMPRGTIIEIANIRNGVKRNHDFYKTQLVNILGWKYNRYIKDGLKIKINFKKDNMSENIKVKKFFPLSENITDWAKDCKKDVEKTKIEIIDILKKELSNKKYRKFLNELVLKIKNDKDLMFAIPLDFEGIKSTVFYGMLNSKHQHGRNEFSGLGFAKVNGISIYQAGRAVFCGPNDENKQTYFKVKDNRGAGLIFQVRLFGYFQIDDYFNNDHVTMDSNKQSFKWDDTPFKKYLDNTMEEYKASGISKAVEMIGRYLNKNVNIGPKKSKASLTKIQQALISRVDQFENINIKVIEGDLYEISNGSSVQALTIDNVKVGKHVNQIKLIEDMFDDDSFIKQKLEENTLFIKINTQHKLWDPYIAESNDEIKRNIVYPLSIMLGIAQYAIVSEEFEAHSDFDLWLTALDQLKQKQ